MPSGVYKHKSPSEETKQKMSKSLKGRVFSKKWKMKISKALLGKKKKPFSEEHKKKISESNIGRKRKPFSEETRRKMSESQKGKHHTKETRLKMSKSKSGKKCHLWKGGISKENRKIRGNIKFRLWREAIFIRDSWTCQKYKIKSGNGKSVYLHPHHIQNFAQYPELRFSIDNGITLSEKAHRKFHKIYGFKNNTKEQLEEFLLSKEVIL